MSASGEPVLSSFERLRFGEKVCEVWSWVSYCVTLTRDLHPSVLFSQRWGCPQGWVSTARSHFSE